MRLIDADALKEDLKLPEESGRMGELLGMVIDAVIEDAPTIEERKKGKWIMSDIQRDEDVANGNYTYICSICNYSDIHARAQTVPYCWHCGADMRG